MRLHFDDVIYFAKNFPKILVRFIKGQIILFQTNPYFGMGLGFGMLTFLGIFILLVAVFQSLLVLLAIPIIVIFSVYFTVGLAFGLDKLLVKIDAMWNRLVAWSEDDSKDKNKPKREENNSRLEHIPRDQVDFQIEETKRGQNASHS